MALFVSERETNAPEAKSIVNAATPAIVEIHVPNETGFLSFKTAAWPLRRFLFPSAN
jgi:hypothetical protein